MRFFFGSFMDTGKEHFVPKPIQELIDEIFVS